MGIYDREYYREGSRGFGFLAADWTACKIFIALNVVAFLLQWIVGPDFTELFIGSTQAIKQGQVWRLLTYAFLHDGPIHLIFNMLFLWMAGSEVERIYGKREFTAMYLAACIIAGLFWLIIESLTPTPAGIAPGLFDPRILGASGAVAAVLVIFAMYYPHREVLLFFILPIPMWLFVVVFLGLDLLGMMNQLQGRETALVAFAAHVGGAGYGFLYKHFDLQWSRLKGLTKRRPRLKVYRPESRGTRRAPTVEVSSRAGGSKPAVAPGSPVNQFPDEHLDAKVDEILAKIAREGRGGLTEEENRILEEASLRARNRRGGRL